MFRRFSTIAMAAAMLLTASCTRENLVGNDPENDGMLKFCLSMSGSPASVLETKSASISTDDGTVSLPLSYERRDGIESRMPAAVPVTKGTQYNSAEQYEGSDSPAFSVVAWNSDGTPFIEDAAEVTYTSGKWMLAPSYKWEPEKDVKTFLAWANAPASGAGIENVLLEGNARQTFTYTVPTDARQQNDVMLGWYKGDGGKSMTAAITMVHPLTAIVFKKGEMDEYITGIKKINISGLCKTGSVDVTYSSSGVPSYVWTMGSQNQSVSLTPLGVEETIEVDGTTSVIGVPFIVLPQTVSASQVKISVVVIRNGNEETLYAYLPAGSLVEGQTNVFTIGHDVYLPEAMPAEFSVSPTKKVYFSRGNLYCTRSGQEGNYTYSFAFEKHQYNFRTRPDMKQFSDDYVTPIDFNTPANTSGLFEWDVTAKGSDFGAFGVAPITTGSSSDVLDFGEAVGANWTTLSAEEWAYLIDTSRGDSRYAKAVVNGVNGLLLFPDGWTNTYNLQGINDSEAAYTTNILALTGTPSWQDVENHGVIFLPAAGCMANNSPSIHGEAYVGAITTVCDYWSSTAADYVTPVAQYLTATYYADNSGTAAVSMSAHNRDYARAVRLVTTVLPEKQKVEFKDLGLPSGTLWANMNIGAHSENEEGALFSWGNTKGYYGSGTSTTSTFTDMDDMTSLLSGGFTSMNYNKTAGSKLTTDIPATAEYDAARLRFGADARIPSKAEWEELLTYTDAVWDDTHKGYTLTSKTNPAASIFLYCAGYGNNEGGYTPSAPATTLTHYWSSTYDPTHGYDCEFNKSSEPHVVGGGKQQDRYHGYVIRAVKSPAPKPDVLPGEFSVSEGVKVKFSKGNLQFKAGNGTAAAPEWRFAENQYEYIGSEPGNTTTSGRSTQSSWIDLFGWGATGQTGINSYLAQPYETSPNNDLYKTIQTASADETLTHTNGGDWGVCMGENWRTLTAAEWQYLFSYGGSSNATREGLFAYGVTVMGKPDCIVLYPDGFTGTKVSNGDKTSYDTELEWSAAQEAGVVCLPVAGYRGGSSLHAVGTHGYYWSSTSGGYGAYCVSFNSGTVTLDASGYRSNGCSVRLVTDAQGTPSPLEVTGEVRTNYNVTNGPKEYKVKSGSPWKLQYTLNGTDWVDAKAGQTIDGWISFDKVSGIVSDQEVSVKATVAPAASPTSITVNHNDNLRNASYKGQNSEVASQQRPYDLSTHDIYGNPTQRNTANCYVISGPGLYAFPLVYGNAIKNGADNKQAYAPTAATNGATYLTPFKGAVNDPVKSPDCNIISPYIPDVATAAPLWEDVAGWALVGENDCKVLSPSQAAAKGLTAGCGYVMFEVKAANLTPGNAVIAVKNSGGTILWSWHLWVTDLDLNTVAVTNSSSQTLNFMPYNLGWVDTENTTATNVYEGKSLKIRFYSDATTSVTKMASRTAFEQSAHNSGQSPTYQWGRKDPFIRVKDMSGDTELTTDEYSGVFISNAGSGLSSSESITNPTCFAGDTYWTSNGGKYNNLWSAQNSTTGTVSAGYSSAPVKTVYDPCPPGFQVPQANAVDHFSASNHDDTPFATLKGYNFYTKPDKAGELFYFPAAGDRGHANGAFEGVTSYSNYWFAVPFNSTDGYHLGFNSSDTVHPKDNNSRAYGFSVRPVKE